MSEQFSKWLEVPCIEYPPNREDGHVSVPDALMLRFDYSVEDDDLCIPSEQVGDPGKESYGDLIMRTQGEEGMEREFGRLDAILRWLA